MNLLELLDRNPNGWGNMPPAQPSQAKIIKQGLPLFSNHPLAGLAANAAQQPGGLFAEPSENRPGLFGYPY